MVKPVGQQVFVTILWSSLAIGTFILVALLIFSLKNFFCDGQDSSGPKRNYPTRTICNDRISLEKLLKYLQIFHICGYILSNIFWIIYWNIALNTTALTTSEKSNYLNYTNSIANIFWAFGTVSFFLLLIVRLYTVFHQTEYQLPRYAFIIWSILLFLILITYCFIIADAYNDWDDDVFNDITFPILVILNMITGLSLIYIFGAKLFKLAMIISVSNLTEYRRFFETTTTETDIDSRIPKTTITDSTSYEWVVHETKYIDTKQVKLLKVMVKNALLGWISIIVIQIYFISEWIELYTKWHYGWNVSSYYYCLRWMIRTIAMSIEIFCVYLSFSVNKKLFRCLCGKCANQLQICCQWRMRQKLINTTKDNEIRLLTMDQH